MRLDNVSLLHLQSAHMRRDHTTQAMCVALDPQFRQLADEAKLVLIYGRIDQLDSSMLDELAWSMDIDWYDVNASVESKRQVIKTALKVYRSLGTPGAVEEVVRAYFGEDSQVVEWFEYGGDPYMFKVTTINQSVTQEKAEEFSRAVNAVKNLRSWLEKVEILQTESMRLYFAGVVHTGDRLTLRQVI